MTIEEIWDNLSDNAVDRLLTHFNFPYYENELMGDKFVWDSFAFPTREEITKKDAELMLKCNMFGYEQHCYALLGKDIGYFKNSENLVKLKESLELFDILKPAQELLNKLNAWQTDTI